MRTIVRSHWCCLLTVAFASAGLSVPIASAQSGDDRPPPEFVRAWQKSVGGTAEAQKEGLAALASRPDWEPYTRAFLNGTVDQPTRDRIRPALGRCRTDLTAWNLERAKTWAKDLHFDYLTDFAAATDDEKAAAEIGTLVIQMQKAVHDKFRTLPLAWSEPPPSASPFLAYGGDYQAFSGKAGFRRYSGDSIWVPKEQRDALAFIHARTGTISANKARGWVALTSTDLDVPRRPQECLGWTHSVVCVNNSAAFPGGYFTLFVCDGDVALKSPRIEASFYHCVIVANGDVVATDEEIHSNSFVYAAGDFSGRDQGYAGLGSVQAGGTVTPMPPEGRAAGYFYKQGVKENPLGVKFVSATDVGVELAPPGLAKTVDLGTLKADSPLAKAGLERGDRILALNGVKMETAADFRRQLRESLLWGTGLFEVKRGDRTFHRLVKFAEQPKK